MVVLRILIQLIINNQLNQEKMKNLKLYITFFIGIASLVVQGQQPNSGNFTPFTVNDMDKNWISINSYNVLGATIGASVRYYDELGKEIQAQTFDPKETRTWASETLYDRQGLSLIHISEPPRDA